MDTVGLKEFRENLTEYERRVKKGQSFVILKRSKPIFTVSPVDEGGWETVIDFTQFKKEGISAEDLLARLQRL